MSQILIIVCERTGQWAAALRRQLDGDHVRLIETRRVDECIERAIEHPRAIVVLEVTETSVPANLATLVRFERELPGVPVIVVAARHLAGCEALMREAGAAHFLVSPRRLGDVVELADRHAARFAVAAPMSDDDDPRLAILARLPWSDMI